MSGPARPGRSRFRWRAVGLGVLLLLSAPVLPARAAGEAPAWSSGPEVPARPAVGFWEHLPGSTALLVPVAAGVAVLIGVALGPRGRPAPIIRREGGLSRALARRSGDSI